MTAEAKPKRKPQSRKPGKRAAITKSHPEGRNSIAGHEERLGAYVKMALMLKRKGLYHHEIGELVADKYDLVTVPAITTVADWLKKGNEAIRKDIEELQWQMRIEQFNQLEKMKGKWFPIATAESLAVTRWHRVEGVLQPELDENALAEQIEATKQVVAIMARQAKLLGLDLEKITAEKGDGLSSLADLQIWMVNQISINGGAPNEKALEVRGETLELEAGLPEGDSV